ncbi:MAG: flagellar biosynthesis regulatory protein FlaF [Micavibrio sp.]|jgi:flagellar protein FlaF|nr:MAG: flagellar biosynthesis regulatory protein FlaF [Micavibrio sp.]
MSPNNNPYTHATNVYGGSVKAATTEQRSLEGQLLIKAAHKLESLKKRYVAGEDVPLLEMEEALSYNRKLWTVFSTEAGNEDHELPQEIKNNIASLAVFIFKRTIELLADPAPQKFNALIEINRNIASGLLKSTATAEKAEEGAKIQEKDSQTTETSAPPATQEKPASGSSTDVQT